MIDFTIKLLYLLLGGLLGFLVAIYTFSFNLQYAQLQRQIDKVSEQRAIVCEAKGTRMECLTYVLEDDVGI